jgi:hypothetical protein
VTADGPGSAGYTAWVMRRSSSSTVSPTPLKASAAHRDGRSRARWLTLAFVLAIETAALPAQGQSVPPRLTQFLHQSIGLDTAEVQQIADGRVVVKVLDTPIKRDVAVFGITRVNVTRDFYVDRVLHTGEWLAAPTRPRFGVFSEPARPRDVLDVTIDRDDVNDLKHCRPGHCNVKLPAGEMQRIRQDIDWSAPDPGPEVDAYARKLMVAYVNGYRAHGDSAMVQYDDRGNVRASDAFEALLAESPYVYQYVAPFHHYLADYPRAHLRGVKDVIYWAEDALPGLRPILSITHLSVYAPPDRPGTTVVAQKQIYADHYFEAVFDLTLVVDRPSSNDEPGIYLVVVRRYRFDHLPGGIFNIRGKVIGKLRDKMRGDLQQERQASQQAFGAH